ncbi:beta-glucoside-specific PTS transporter subunit IIABC [Corynebacterium sp. sy039]|uniref:beta-glucoside-specific PTS transporter subunit IIABC n=1 Tax=Corynebacterium sp. sy039 TaxID=2599641 RepID=UPI0011B5D00C|nr:beta-glucoside-specific PTS transporter subunit IIABC [Corynebacterium sp. sy039]QDZ42177.1 PTS beta-glucoside transporter subunit EIIBCA [Corynebacterium sp. sy039]
MVEKIRDYQKIAAQIVELVGGAENITNLSRCATRLRLVLAHTPADAKEKVSALPGVITTVENAGQFQVVIGNRVGEVFDALSTYVNLDTTSVTETQQSFFNRIVSMVSAVFAPFIYVLAAAGLLQGILIIISAFAPSVKQTGTFAVFDFISWTPFTFLPIFIAITAAKFFKVDLFVALLCVAALVSPTWAELAARVSAGEKLTFFGMALNSTTYTSTVLPALILVWLLSYVERACKKLLPAVVTQLFTPLICVVIMVPLTIMVLGPLSAGGANAIANGYNWLVEIAPPVAAAIVGGLWQVIVIFGVHWGITPVILSNFDQYGSDSFQVFQTAAVVGQIGAVFGVLLKSKNKERKRVAGSAVLTGIFGITEPAIYGVTLSLKKPFICGCVSGSLGAMVIAFFGSRQYVYAGLPGPLTAINAYHPGTNSLVGALIGYAVAFIGAVILTYTLGFREHTPEKTTATAHSTPAGEEVMAPVSGKIIALEQIPDPVFSGGAMGAGCAIAPNDTKILAPFDGKVVTVLPSQHAIGLISDEGVELLIHVGLDTVTLEGVPFKTHIAKGDRVRVGQLLLEFDKEYIEQAGLSTLTPVILTNTKAFGEVICVADPESEIHVGQPLLLPVKEKTVHQKG